MSNLNNMGLEFKEYAELKQFAEAQQKTILTLSKQIKQKDEEIKHLQKLLSDSTPVIKDESPLILNTESMDEEAICRMELRKLRECSVERELTLEEAKKVDIYTKLLINLKNKDTKPVKEKEVKELTNEALLSALSEPVEEKK